MYTFQVSLHSMHKYLPRVHILQTTDLQTPPEQQASLDCAVTYSFAETTFTTVTAYQNQQVSVFETLHKFSSKRIYSMILQYFIVLFIGPRRVEVTGEWRRLHNEELNDLYPSPNIVRVIKSRRMRWAGHVARVGEERGVYRFLVVKPEGKSPLGRPRRRWVDNIRMDLQEVGCGYIDWIGLAQD